MLVLLLVPPARPLLLLLLLQLLRPLLGSVQGWVVALPLFPPATKAVLLLPSLLQLAPGAGAAAPDPRRSAPSDPRWHLLPPSWLWLWLWLLLLLPPLHQHQVH